MSKYDDGEKRPGAKPSEDPGRSQELGLGKETVIPFPPLGGVHRHELGPGKQTPVPVLDWDGQPVAPVQLHRLGVPDVGKYSLIPTISVQRSASGDPDAVTQDAAWAGLVQLARGARGGQPAEGTASVHAADRVVAGQSAAALLDQMSGSGHREAAVQRAPAMPGRGTATGVDSEITPPTGGINKPGFIDNSDGSNLRAGPAKAGGKLLRDKPLPPATRVFVSGTHPSAQEWWHVTAYLDGMMVRGYVQHGRVNTDLPKPTAKLHQVVSGDTAEKLAVQEYKSSVHDGHDLRHYENVLLYVNQHDKIPRAGIAGSYQDPGVLGGGINNVKLVAGHRIWLVSPDYAKAIEGVVPDGSLTGGAVAKAKRFVAHLEDILRSVTESRHHFGEVAGEYAQAIRDHLPEIAGIVAAFIMAEATSAFLAATPTGVGQIIAVVIRLGLSAFGAAGAVQVGAEAVKHGGEWLTLAWTAKGDDKQIGAASKEFLKMLVGIAMAALSALGAKANYGNALKIASSMPTGGLPALAVAGGGQIGGAGAGTVGLIGPSTGSIGAAGNATMQADKDGQGGNDGSKSTDPAKELEEGKQKLEPPPAGADGGPTTWVDENAHMSPDARGYQDSAHGARSNRVSKAPQAPELVYRAADGSRQKVRFDGVEGGQMIDRKKAITTFPKSERQALRQSDALTQNGLTAVWEVPSAAEAARATRLLSKLNITNITVRVVKP